jgi:endogenous inhibitor of DNA gyrase (YacG/DUF329 family)
VARFSYPQTNRQFPFCSGLCQTASLTMMQG